MFIAISLLFSLTITSVNAVEVSQEAKITGLYVAFFSRAADQAGLEYWTTTADNVAKEGGDVSSVFRTIAKGFATHPTFKSTYGTLNNKEFVEAIYRNALGRDGDAEGVAYWTDLIDNMSRSDMVATFVELSMVTDLTKENYPNLKAEELAAAQLRQDLISNKAEVAVAFTKQLEELSNVKNSDDPEKDPAYIASIMIISGVTEDKTTVIAAIVFITEVKKSDDPIEEIKASVPDWNSISEFYAFWVDHDNGQFRAENEKIIFDGGVLTFEEYDYDPKTSQWVLDTEDEDNRDYDLNTITGAWESEENTESYTISADGTIMSVENGKTEIKIASVTDLSGQTVTIDEEMGLKVTFSAGAKKYNLAFKDAAEYEIWYMPTLQIQDPDTNAWIQTDTTFSDVLSYMNSVNSVSGMHTETGWRGVDFERRADSSLHFYDAPVIDSKGAKITALSAGMSGSVVTVDHSNAYNEGTSMAQTVIGTWTATALPGQTALSVIVTLNAPYETYAEDKHPLVAVKDGIVYIGEYKEAMSTFKADSEDVMGNLQAMKDIKAAVEAYDFSAPPPSIDLSALLAGKTLYTTIWDDMGTLESWAFNADLTGSTWTELVGGTATGTGTLSVDGMTMTYTCTSDSDAECEVNPTTIEVKEILADYLVLEVRGGELGTEIETLRLYFDEVKAREYLLAGSPTVDFTELLTGKTLYQVWYGMGVDANGNDIDNVAVLSRVTINANGTVEFVGLINGESGTGKWEVTGNKFVAAEVSESFDYSEYNQYVSGDIASGCIQTNWVNENNANDNNVDLFFTDETRARNYANNLTDTARCP